MTGARATRSASAALVAAGLIDEAAARRAEGAARASGAPLVAVLHQLALADDNLVAQTLAAHFSVPRAMPADMPALAVEVPGLSVNFLRRKRVLPLGWSGKSLIVGVVDPEDSEGLAALSFSAACAAEPRLLSYSEWTDAFARLYGAEDIASAQAASQARSIAAPWADDTDRVRDSADAAPAVRLVDALLERAINDGASDIHIEPLPDRVRIRLRIDGDLRIVQEEPAFLAAPIAARIKILADMDVANRRAPQDGRTSLAAKGRPVDVRISSVPSTYGETIALRLLRRDPALLDLAGLGFSTPLLALFQHVLSLRRGLFLVTGPTGSGKTTTLYAMLERLRAHNLKILSIEDPVEYFFSDITQTQVNEDAGLSFATALRSFLRQDPDVILVGEIRDAETARIAVQAALTGHLVLATLHTVDAPGAVARLVDMGVDRYLVSATLAGVVSQRLVRKLCTQCKRGRTPSAAELALIGEQAPDAMRQIYEAPGCAKCRDKGYLGRLAIGEGFLNSEAVSEAMLDPNAAALQRLLARAGYVPLMADAARLVAAGETSLAEFRALSVA